MEAHEGAGTEEDRARNEKCGEVERAGMRDRCKAEKIIRDQQRQLFHNTLRQAQCQTDEWYGLTMEDIRRLEAEVVAKLEAKRQTNSAK
ncbi:hypothetical protein PC120_g23385 [Phytophthora cactorum]|nr:hypothetical protein PC120_g23385 [Phytophthora cactorum]